MKRSIPVMLLIISAIISCTRHSEVSDTLAHADAVMEQHPDSALALLEAIPDSTLVTDRDRALHALLLTQALDKNYIDVTSDSLINIAVNYFQNHGDRYEMLSHYYYAKAAYNSDEYIKSTFAALKAKELSEGIKDTLFIARSNEIIADLYFRNFDFTNEIKHRKIAIRAYHYINKDLSELYANIDLALAYTQNDNPDSALNQLKQIEPSIRKIDSHLYKSFLEAHIQPYILMGEYEAAKNVSDRLIELFGEDNYSHSTYAEIAESYLKVNDISGAQHFINKSISHDIESKSSVNVLIRLLKIRTHKSDDNLIVGLVDSVQKAQNQYAKRIVNQQISCAERDFYRIKSIESDKRESLSKRNMTIVGLIGTIIMIVIIFLYLYQRAKNKNLRLKIENDLYRLKELETNLWQFKESVRNQDDMRKTIETLFHQKFELINSFSHYYDLENKHEENAVIVYRKINRLLSQFCDKDSLKDLEKVVNKYQNDIMKRFRILFPNLSASQYQLALYIFLDFSPDTMCIFLKIPKNNFYVYRSRLKKLLNQSKDEIPEDIMRYFN